MGNFIKLNRKILKWEWWHDIKTYRLFSYMLLAAWWKNGNYKGEPIPRGSFPSSISDLSKETDLSDNEVRTALKHLKSTGEITSKSHSKFTVFTVKNYELYQGDNEQLNEEITSNLTSNLTRENANSSQGINKDLTSKSQADNEQITGSNNSILNNIDTIKENKEDNNINNIQEDEEREEEKKKTRKKKKSDGVQHKYGEYQHVLLTDAQYQSLIEDFGEEQVSEMIKILDEGIQRKGYKYKDFNLTLRGWVLREYNDRHKNSFYQNSYTKKEPTKRESLFNLLNEIREEESHE